jgi:hypothetical protein
MKTESPNPPVAEPDDTAESAFTEDIAHGVRKAGELPAEHFPRP